MHPNSIAGLAWSSKILQYPHHPLRRGPHKVPQCQACCPAGSPATWPHPANILFSLIGKSYKCTIQSQYQCSKHGTNKPIFWTQLDQSFQCQTYFRYRSLCSSNCCLLWANIEDVGFVLREWEWHDLRKALMIDTEFKVRCSSLQGSSQNVANKLSTTGNCGFALCWAPEQMAHVDQLCFHFWDQTSPGLRNWDRLRYTSALRKLVMSCLSCP